MHLEPLQPSTRFYPRFSFSTLRSSGFGLHTSDSRPFQSAPLIACGLVAFASGPPLTGLPLPLTCTPWHVIHNGLCNAVAPQMSLTHRFQGF